MKKSLLAFVISACFLGFFTAQTYGLNAVTLINRSHPLQPRYYAPSSLVVPSVLLADSPDNPEMQMVPAAANSLTNLFRAAQSNGIELVLSSGYRPYEDQFFLYTTQRHESSMVSQESVAPPGYSEHQSGLAADIITPDYFCAAQGCFALSKAAAWLNQNSHAYGFIVRYPLYKEASTGYEYEPWHLRYVGRSLASQLYRNQETLEEFYGLP